MNKKVSRRQQILESLAHMLEVSPGERITTARLAKEVGVSEAALYRHFPSKSKMFEGLIEFVEETIFSRVNLICSENLPAIHQCERILTLLLAFTERNPGITRIFNGDVLTGENERLRNRVDQFYDRLETQLKKILREAEIREGLRTQQTVNCCANLMLSTVEGKISQFVRSEFKKKPSNEWPDQWQLLSNSMFIIK